MSHWGLPSLLRAVVADELPSSHPARKTLLEVDVMDVVEMVDVVNVVDLVVVVDGCARDRWIK